MHTREEMAMTKLSAGAHLARSLSIADCRSQVRTKIADFVFRVGECIRSVWQVCALRIVPNPRVQVSDREEI
jgi:hypothetical protein